MQFACGDLKAEGTFQASLGLCTLLGTAAQGLKRAGLGPGQSSRGISAEARRVTLSVPFPSIRGGPGALPAPQL